MLSFLILFLQLYIFACHLGSLVVNPPATEARNFTQLIAKFSKRSQALPYPTVPLHLTLPQEDPFDFSIACDSRRCLKSYSANLNEFNKFARSSFKNIKFFKIPFF